MASMISICTWMVATLVIIIAIMAHDSHFVYGFSFFSNIADRISREFTPMIEMFSDLIHHTYRMVRKFGVFFGYMFSILHLN